MTKISDADLLRALRERDRAREQDALARAAALDEAGPCPVCKGTLTAGALHPALAPVRAVPALLCARCRFAAPLKLNALGLALSVAVGVAVGLFGLMTVFDAQQLTDGQARLTRFLFGGVLLCLGFALGSHGSGHDRRVAQRILEGWREREEGPRKGPPPSWLGDNLRELVFAAILYLVLRQFVVEAFVIPTGSMAPTLYGNNYRVECTRCAYPFAVGKSEGELATGPASAVCPLCGQGSAFMKEDAGSDGNKIIVNKLLYRVAAPERYDVFVFRNPQKPWESYIKRLVGLPGETIQVKNGDLYANGVLQPKPPHVQDAVWIPVHDARYPWPGLDVMWAPVGPADAQATEVARDGSTLTLRPAQGEAWLEFQRRNESGSDHGISDMTSYNRSGNSRIWGTDAVTDLRVTALALPARGAITQVAVVADERAVVAAFPAEGASTNAFTLSIGGAELARSEARAPLEPGVPTEVQLAYADDRVRLIVDGETLLDVADPTAPDTYTARSAVRVGATGGQVTFSETRIDRDIFYRSIHFPSRAHNDPAVQPVEIPAGRYFAMGDNTPSSEDSRSWGFVHEGHIQGRAFLVWWPLVKPFDGRLVR